MYKNTIAYSFGKNTQRLHLGKKSPGEPGPGEYLEKVSNVRPSSSSYSFCKTNKFEKNKSITPGPGYYQKQNLNLFGGASSGQYGQSSKKGYTIGKTLRGSVTHYKTFDRNIISGETTSGLRNETPGPGEYEPDGPKFDKTKPRPKSFKMSISTKDVNYNNNVPGPGEYLSESVNHKIKSPQFSMPKSRKEGTGFVYKKTISPGPAQYLSKSSFEGKKSGFTFNKLMRMKSENKGNPGPGEYMMGSSIGYMPAYMKTSTN